MKKFNGLFFILFLWPEILLADQDIKTPDADAWYNNPLIIGPAAILLFGLLTFIAYATRPKRVGPDGKVYYRERSGFYVYRHPDGKVDLWPGDGKGDGDKKE